MVVWIIGLSGSGKTTLGTEMYNILRKSDDKWIFLDGDMVRTVLGEDLGHTLEDRRKNANRITNLCRLLDSQGINVLACVLSIFKDNQRDNRKNFSSYKEIFMDVDFSKLLERDNKNLYKQALKGEIKDVVGVDIDFPRPENSDVVIDNNEDNMDFTRLAYGIIEKLKISLSDVYEYSKIDGLKYPHKYQYTAFEGPSFLNKYLKSREDTTEILNTGIHKLIKRDKRIGKEVYGEDDLKNDMSLFINEIDMNMAKDRDLSQIITEKFLFDLLIELIENQDSVSEEVIHKLLLFIKRFEVSKKLYSKYEVNTFKKASSDYNKIVNYLLFSNVLSKAYFLQEEKHKKYIFFNALLKVNDLIISIIQRVVTLEEKLLTYHAIKGELEIYSCLKEEHLC